MEQVTAYMSSDGNIFATVDQCQEHEVSLLWRQRIDEFTASGLNPYPSGAQFGMTRKIIIAWERFKTGA
jgi:hypothetical protein